MPKFDTVEISQDDFKNFTGDYTSADLPLDLKIFKHGLRLVAQATDQPAFELKKIKENEFESKEFGVKMTLAKDGKTMTMTQNGKSYNYKKK